MERRGLRDLIHAYLDPVPESPSVTLLRRSAATLSILFGVFGLSAAFSLLLGDTSWRTAPGIVLLVAGGVLGAVAWWTVADILAARRAGKWAAVSTLGRTLLFALAVALS